METQKNIELAKRWKNEYPEYFSDLTINEIVQNIIVKSLFRNIVYLGDYLTTKVKVCRLQTTGK